MFIPSPPDPMFLAAAALSSQSSSVRDKLIHMVHQYAVDTNATVPFPDLYDIHTAVPNAFQARSAFLRLFLSDPFLTAFRPVQGSAFSLLALG
jgi:hypothetical protein